MAVVASLAVALMAMAGPVAAAPFAALVMDARTGEVLYSKNATTRLHPASLTKMLTLYIVFDAIKRGEITLDTQVKVSKNAAAQAPSRLGLRAGQKIALRYLIRAAAIKSANDAASAIGDALEGSEQAFAKRMNRTAKALGMKDSTFRNANGLTREGHMSTAYDMTLLGRHLLYDHPEYYNLFSRRTTDAGIAAVANTNRRFLDAYPGADGIKTGFTNAAGFNLVASAERGGKRIIATVFGGTSTAQRNAKAAELLDLGFGKAPADVPGREPVQTEPLVADAEIAPTGPVIDEEEGGNVAVRTAGLAPSLRPLARPVRGTAGAVPPGTGPTAMQDGIATALADVQGTENGPGGAGIPGATVAQAAPPTAALASIAVPTGPALLSEMPGLADTPGLFGTAGPADAAGVSDPASATLAFAAAPAALPVVPRVPPKARPEMILLAAAPPADTDPAPEIVSRMSTSGGRLWGITIGRFTSQAEADRVLLKTALAESATLSDALRKVVHRPTGFDANFVGMSQDTADLACRRLQARNVQCFTLGP